MRVNLYGIDVTTNKKNDDANIVKLATNKVSGELKDEVEELEKEAQTLNKKIKPPLWLTITEYVTYFAGLILLLVFLELVGNEESQASEDVMSYLALSVLVLVGIYTSVMLYKRKLRKQTESSDELKEFDTVSSQVEEQLVEYFEIPDDAYLIDCLACKYKIKNNEEKIVKFNMYYVYIPVNSSMFVKEGNLYITNYDSQVVIPVSGFGDIKEIDKNIIIPIWNKPVEPSSDEYKEYKIKSNQYGISFKKYHQVSLDFNGEEYYLLIPDYDINKFKQLINK